MVSNPHAADLNTTSQLVGEEMTASVRKNAWCAAALLWVWTGVALAQPYPTRTVRMINPGPPGGGIDTVGRTIAQKLSGALGQPVVVDNRPGAGTTLASELVAKAPPDGHTLLIMSNSHAITASLYKKLSYDPIKDFSAVTLLVIAPYILVVHPSVPVRSVKELVALAKRRPGELFFASAGSGAGTHLAGELFKSMAQVDIVHVPYKGGAPAVTDLVGGHVQIMFNAVVSSTPLMKANRLRALAITSAKRSQMLPGIPTLAESGLPGYEAGAWYGVLVPARTPAHIVATLNLEIVKVLKLNDVREKLMADGSDMVGSTPEEFSAYMKTDIERWAKLIAALGLRAE